MEEDYQPIAPEAYDRYLEMIAQGINESQGYKREALRAQMEDARAARQNAMEIARLQASTSRYGVDVASRDRMAALKEQARQFDSRHGLDIAEAYTRFASTPDMMFARSDLMHGLERVGQGLMPRAATSHPVQPQAKSWEDFAALSRYQGPGQPAASSSTAPGGNSFPTASQEQAASAGSGAQAAAAPASAGTGTDPRVTAANAVMKAIPPSESMGADGQDWAALNAIRQLYTAAAPGSLERLGEARGKITLAGLARMGYDPAAVLEDYKRAQPGQLSPRLA